MEENRIKEWRELRGLTMEVLAERMGTTASQVNKLEKGQRELTQSWIFKAAAALGVHPADILPASEPGPDTIPALRVRFIGDVQAGVFREALEWSEEDQFEVDVPVDNRYRRRPVFGLQVRGDSMNKVFPHGTLVTCVKLMDLGEDFELDSGRYVVVLRRNENGPDEFEATIKQYEVDAHGMAWLWPRSDNPEFQSPIKALDLSNGRHDDFPDGNEGVRIWALVIGFHRTL